MGTHNGFTSYLTEHKFTEEFIEDFKYWTKRIYWNWRGLGIEFDTFLETCWEALLTKIDEFDENIATIQTFCISRINNEAWRFYMKNKTRKIEIDCDSEVIKNTLEEPLKEDIMENLSDFIIYCSKKGITVNKIEFLKEYTENKKSPAMIAYAYWRMSQNEIGGRNDFPERRRTRSKVSSKE